MKHWSREKKKETIYPSNDIPSISASLLPVPHSYYLVLLPNSNIYVKGLVLGSAFWKEFSVRQNTIPITYILL